MQLTELKLKNIPFATDGNKPELYADGDGLYLRVTKSKKGWYLRFMKQGKLCQFYSEKDYPAMSLKDARRWAAETRDIAEISQVSTMSKLTFKHFFDEYRKQQVNSKRSAATLKKLDLRANKYMSPLYSRDIRTITPQDVLQLLKGIEANGKKLEASRQVRGILSNIFLLAKIAGVINSNPCEGLSKALAKASKKSMAAITDIYEFGQLLNKLDEATNALPVKASLQLHALVFTRPVELRLATWSEVNLEDSMWVIPKERMKMGETDLMIPLSKQATKLLSELKKQSESKYVFSIAGGKPYSDAILRMQLNRMGYYGSHKEKPPQDAKFHSPHGFRASFRTIAAEVLEWRVDVLELQLNHKVRDANGNAYNRATFLEKRKLMMQLWADFCDVLKTGNKKQIEAFIKKHKGVI